MNFHMELMVAPSSWKNDSRLVNYLGARPFSRISWSISVELLHSGATISVAPCSFSNKQLKMDL